MKLPPSVFEEFRASAIPDELTNANIEWIEGDRAIEIMSENAIEALGGHSQQYQTKAVQRILERYEFAREGGWVTFGQDIDGNDGTVACFKPKNPRPKKDFKGFGPEPTHQKFIKYEVPQGQKATPMLTKIPFRFGLEIAINGGKGDEYTKRFYETQVKGAEETDDKAEAQKPTRASEEGEDSPLNGIQGANSDPTQLTDSQRRRRPDRCTDRSECQQLSDETAFRSACEREQWGQACAILRAIWDSPRNRQGKLGRTDCGRIERLGDEIDRLIWRWIEQEKQISITIVEGDKKAWSLINQGRTAIACRGITMWHKKDSRELHDEIAAFATPGRQIFIGFDQDEKPKTVKNVRQQAIYLGQELEKSGAIVRFLHWEPELGKGIDDVLFHLEVESKIDRWAIGRELTEGDRASEMVPALMNYGDDAEFWMMVNWAIAQFLLTTAEGMVNLATPTPAEWLNETMAKALTIKQFARFNIMARALEVLDRLEQLSYPIERETDGDNTPEGYLPELPPIRKGHIHVVDCGLGGGKTYRIGEDWIPRAKDAGKFVIALAPMNSLGQQTGQRWGLPHIHDFDPKDSHLLWTMARDEGGVVMCVDSLHRLPSWVFEKDIVVVMDEANQVCQGLSGAGTLGDRQSDILKLFTQLLEHATATGAIVMSEDGIADRAVRFIESLSQAKGVRVFRHRRTQLPWDCTMYYGNNASGFRARLLGAIASGQKILYVASSQHEAERVERAIDTRSEDIKVVRIDGDTNEAGQFIRFFNQPDEWIADHQPDVLILSPSAKSGISIEQPYFDAVWGYFPSLSSDVHWQLLGRYRCPVPRHIYCPPFIAAGADEAFMSPYRAKAKYRQTARAMASGFGIEELLSADETDERIARIETALMDYHSAQVAVAGAQKAIAYDYLLMRLQRSGHLVRESTAGFDQAVSELWKQLDKDIWMEQAKEISSLVIEEEHTVEWAYKTLNGVSSSKIERLRAQKVLWREEFPGVLFDDFDECYEGLCLNHGAMRRGVRLQARAENLQATAILDKARAEKLLGMDVKALHRLPKEFAKARLIAATGVLSLLDGKPYQNGDRRVADIKAAALKWATEISYWLRLSVDSSQTGIEIAHKLLKKLGIVIEKPDRPGAIKFVARPGQRGTKRGRFYRVDLGYSPVRQKLLDAARQKLLGVVSSVCNQDLVIETTDTDLKPIWHKDYEVLAQSLEPDSLSQLLTELKLVNSDGIRLNIIDEWMEALGLKSA